MKKILNNKLATSLILSLLLTVAFLGTAQAATFDTQARPIFQVANYTDDPNGNTWFNSVTADAGDIVSFRFFYYNTSTETATTTMFRVNIPSTSATVQTVTGQIWAQNTPEVSGTVQVNLTSNQTLSLIPEQVYWINYTTPTTLPFGQNGSEIGTVSGLTIGNVAPGISNSGYIVARARVSGQDQNPSQTQGGLNVTTYSNIGTVLKGSVSNGNYAANTWFEYGTDLNLNSSTRTTAVTVGPTYILSAFESNLTNLIPNTIYYFRAVAQNISDSSISRGSILSFNSSGQNSSTITTSSNPNNSSVVTNSAYNINISSANLDAFITLNNSNTTAWFEYGTTQSLGTTVGTQILGTGNSQVDFYYYLSGLALNTTYYFRAAAQNNNITSYGSVMSFITGQNSSYYTSPPTAITNSATSVFSDSAVLNATINSNNYATDYWFEYGTTSALETKIPYKNLGSYNYQLPLSTYVGNLSPNTTYYFRTVARNVYGTNYGSILSFITRESNGISATGSQPTVITSPAMFVRQNSALLNGMVIPNNNLTSAWFEWSETTDLSSGINKNASQTIGQGNEENYLAYSLTNLILGKTYYFRAVAQNNYGTIYGDIKSFIAQDPILDQTTNTTPQTNFTPVINYTKPVSINGLITLGAEFSGNARPGKEVIYTVNYKNNSDSALNNISLEVILPNEAAYENSSLANVNLENNIASFKLNDIIANDSGSVSIKVKITELAKVETLNFDSTINYSMGGKSGKENLVSELKLNPFSLAASALDTLGNIFGNAFVDLILGGLIGAWIYRFVAKKKEIVDKTDPLK